MIVTEVPAQQEFARYGLQMGCTIGASRNLFLRHEHGAFSLMKNGSLVIDDRKADRENRRQRAGNRHRRVRKPLLQ